MRKLISLLTIFITTSATPLSVVACGNKQSNNINNLLTHTDLGVIDSFGMAVPTQDELQQAVKDKNPAININALKFENQKDNSATVVGDGITYVGQKTVNFNLKNKIAITDIIPNGVHINTIVQTEGKPSPSEGDIINALQIEYANKLNVDKISITDINNNQATVKSDGTTYTGTAIIIFDVNIVTELSKVITNPKIGVISTQGNDTPSVDQISTTLVTKFPTLNPKAIKIDSITNISAIVTSGDYGVYTLDSKITLSFITDKHMDFNKILQTTKLGSIHIDAKAQAPTSDQIKLALKANNINPNLNVNYIKVDNITPNSAQISSTDQSYYQGDPISVTYQINKSSDLSLIIPEANRDLGTFKFPADKKIPSIQDITDKLSHYSLNWNKIIVQPITATSAVLSSNDQNVYTGTVTLTFKVDNSVALASVLQVTELGTINTNGLPMPSVDLLVQSIVKANSKVDSKYITVSDISATGAKVKGNNIYHGTVDVKFTVENSKIAVTFKYQEDGDYNPGALDHDYTGPTQTLLSNWTQYAANWDEFAKKFPNLTFDKNSTISLVCNTYTNQSISGDKLNINVNNINTDKNTKFFYMNYDYEGGFFGASVHISINIFVWHDDKNVYTNCFWHMSTSKCLKDRVYNVNLENPTFHK